MGESLLAESIAGLCSDLSSMEQVESCLGFLLFGLELLPSAPNKEALFYREIANSSSWNGHSRAGNFVITFRTSRYSLI